MSQALSKEEALHVAELAKIDFTDKEMDVLLEQLSKVLDLVDTLNEVDTTNVEPTYSITQNINMFRDDVAQDWQQKEALLKNAPESKDGLIKVPSILDGGDN